MNIEYLDPKGKRSFRIQRTLSGQPLSDMGLSSWPSGTLPSIAIFEQRQTGQGSHALGNSNPDVGFRLASVALGFSAMDLF